MSKILKKVIEKTIKNQWFPKGDYNEDYDPEKDYGDYYDYDYDKSKDEYDQDENVTTGENVQVRVEPDLELIEAGPKENDTVRFDYSQVSIKQAACLPTYICS